MYGTAYRERREREMNIDVGRKRHLINDNHAAKKAHKSMIACMFS